MPQPTRSQISLLLQGEGDDASLLITDSSPWADHRMGNASLAISTTQRKHGGSSIRTDRSGPLGLTWSHLRFSRSADGLTCEGHFRSETQQSTTSTPPLFQLEGTTGTPLVYLTKFGTGNRVFSRFGYSDSGVVHDYTPGPDGWTYWMLRIPADSGADMELWVNDVLMRSGGQVVPQDVEVACRVAGGAALGGVNDALCYHDSIRVSRLDVYPDGITSIPGPFDDGTTTQGCIVWPAGSPQ